MKKIVVASKNPVKVNATLLGFQRMFPDEEFEAMGVSVTSGVSEQPRDEMETADGAHNRVRNACKKEPNADFYVGIEGGVEDEKSDMKAFAWVVIRSKKGGYSKSRTGTFFLPPQVAELIRQGKELGEADDIVFGRINSKQENGAVGILTNDAVNRRKYYTDAVVLALIPFKNKKLYNQ